MFPNHIMKEILEYGLFHEVGELLNHTKLEDLTPEHVKDTFTWIYFREYGFFEVDGNGATHHHLVACYDMLKNMHTFDLNDTEKEDILSLYNDGDLSSAFQLLRVCRTEIDDYMAILKYPVCYKSRAGRDNLIIGTSEHLTPTELYNFSGFDFEYDI